VTGGSRGIGRAVATRLAEEGVRVAICARTQEPLEAAAAEIGERTGAEILPLVCDVRDRASVDAFVATTAQRFGALEIVVSSADRVSGSGVPETLEQVSSGVRGLCS
jgi:NAD(P)-dependent dehydrogenase (short-subunit alcohol dehydrogenase family)